MTRELERERIMAILQRQGYYEVSAKNPSAWETREILQEMAERKRVALVTPVQGSYYVYSLIAARETK
jgi:hypothetical protein